MAFTGIRRPFRSGCKLRQQPLRKFVLRPDPPVVPEIVGDSPHLGVLPHFLCMTHIRRPWREAEHNWPAGLIQRLTNHADFVAFVGMVGNAVPTLRKPTPQPAYCFASES